MPRPYVPKPAISPDDAEYATAARAEAEFWSAPDRFSIVDAWASAADGPIKRYYNRRLTGDERTPWYRTIARRGPFKRGLVLGSGGLSQEAGILETNPGVRLTFCDIDPSGLAARADAFDARFPGRIATRQADLNFAELEAGAYDLIVSASTLHHIVNLEHVATQIARALTDDGWFFLYDYTGESGMRFPAEQKRAFELIYAREQARHADLPSITWHDIDDETYSPFEAIRSGETVGILQQHLHEVERSTAGAVIGLLFFAGLTDDASQRDRKWDLATRIKRANGGLAAAPLVWEQIVSPECIRELALVDDVLCEAEIFRPNNTFATYRKKRSEMRTEGVR